MTLKLQDLPIQGTYDYDSYQLKQLWPRLHRCASEPFPDADYLRGLSQRNPRLLQSMTAFDGDYGALSERLLEAWRLFHLGQFQQAMVAALALGYPGYLCANMAACIYGNVCAEPQEFVQQLYLEVAKRSQEAAAIMPEHVNSTYFYGLGLGRYSETISLLKAATQNIAPKFSKALLSTLAQVPDHLFANIGMGSFNASVVHTVGSLLARLSYGCTRDAAYDYYENGLRIAPQLPVVYIEYAKGVMLLEGSQGQGRAQDLYARGAAQTPMDAMEALDVARCRAALQ